MADSYYRKCRDCGRQIQLRKMPGGHWTAWEGYNQLHNCAKPVAARTAAPPPNRREVPEVIRKDFEEFQLPGGTPPLPPRASTPVQYRAGGASKEWAVRAPEIVRTKAREAGIKLTTVRVDAQPKLSASKL